MNGYSYKYYNGKDKSELYDYKILDSPDISYFESIDGTFAEITCIFNKLDIEQSKANVTYFFKDAENSTHVYSEDINIIPVIQSPLYCVFERNPFDNNGKITLRAFGFLTNWVYLNVIAQIQQNNILECVAYNGVKMTRPSSNKKVVMIQEKLVLHFS